MDPADCYKAARTVAATGNYEYPIHMYLTGLEADPDNVEIHRELRDVSLRRKAAGGGPVGMFNRLKLRDRARAGDDKTRMLVAEHVWAYDPDDFRSRDEMLRHARSGGFDATADWIESLKGGRP